MARPVKPRELRSYTRDIESLTRLRTALTIDTRVAPLVRTKIHEQIDALIKSLSVFIRQ